MNTLTDIKEKARKEFVKKIDDSTVYVNGISWLDTLIDRTALAVLDMTERRVIAATDPESAGTRVVQALRAEIEGKKGCCEDSYDDVVLTGCSCPCHLEGKIESV